MKNSQEQHEQNSKSLPDLSAKEIGELLASIHNEVKQLAVRPQALSDIKELLASIHNEVKQLVVRPQALSDEAKKAVLQFDWIRKGLSSK